MNGRRPPPPSAPSTGSAPGSSNRAGVDTAGRPFGSFILDERLAVGGTSEVYLAHPRNGIAPAPRLVIKRLLPRLRGDSATRAMFAEEASLHSRFRHPNIVACFGAGEVEGEPYLAMELVAGSDLHRVLRLGQARNRPLTPALTAYVGRAILAGLAVVHAGGVVHRDLSPSNIYLSLTGDVKLGDFGIARASTARGRTPPPPGIRGKYAYLAPEQVASQPVDHRADLFSLANVLAEMILGRPLFPGSGQLAVLLAIRDARVEALTHAPTGVPAPLIAILRRALSRDPADRFGDASEFSSALAPFAVEEPDARQEIEQLVRSARQLSIELRAVGEHPDDKSAPPTRPPVSLYSPTPPAAPQTPSASRAPQRPSPHAPPPARAHDPVYSAPTAPQPSAVARRPMVPPPATPHAELEIRLDSLFPTGAGTSPPSPHSPPSPGHEPSTKPFAPPPSHVRTSDRRVIGPYNYAKLVELVATGRLSPDDEVDFMGTGFQRLAEIDDLSRHLAPRSVVTVPIAAPGNADWIGLAAERFDREIGAAVDPGIANALAYVASRNASGVLFAQRATKQKELYFDTGRLLHVASSEAGELIGEYLVGRGLLDRADLDFALAVLPRFGGRLGEALAQLGLLDAVEMFRAIQEQGRDKVVELFTWSDGELSFYAGAQPSRVEFPLDLAVGPIVEAGAAAILDESKAMARYRPWMDRRLVAVEAPPMLRAAGWSPLAERALALARAPTTVRALLRALTMHPCTVREAACAVESMRVVHLLEWTT